MAVSTSDDTDVLSEINITPLVDVMLVLLVAFVITIPALTNAIHVNLPRTVQTTPPEQQNAITVTVDTTGTVYFDDAAGGAGGSRTAPARHQGQHRRAVTAPARRRPRAVRLGGQGHGGDRALRDLQGLGAHRQRVTPRNFRRRRLKRAVVSNCTPNNPELVTEHAITAPRAVAAAVSLALLAPALALAADGRTAAEIQAEIDRLTAELEAQKQALAATQAASRPNPPPWRVWSPTRHRTPRLARSPCVHATASSRLQEVPLSISVVTGKELDRLQATEIGAITQRAVERLLEPGQPAHQ